MVLYGHAVGTAGFPVARHGLGLAEAGVRVFFIISGFLITKLLLEELDSTGTISLKGFYRRRVLRIFPAFYTYWFVTVLLVASGFLAIRAKYLVYAAIYVIDYVPSRPWHLGHLWSLAVEEQFYALWPLTLFLLGRRRAFWVAGLGLLLAPLFRVAQFYLVPWDREGITMEIHNIGDCIATGCLLAGLRDWLWRQERYRQWLTSPKFWLLPAVIGLTLVMDVHPRVKWVVGIPVFNVAVALCIDRWTRFPNRDLVGAFLNWKPVAFIGVLSYSLYLWQQPFLNRDGHHSWNAFPWNVALAFVAALASYYVVERPFLALRYKPPRRQPVASVKAASG
jgi:peptidoglycan/LPS O-acetylase OafA/YrhL